MLKDKVSHIVEVDRALGLRDSILINTRVRKILRFWPYLFAAGRASGRVSRVDTHPDDANPQAYFTLT